MKQLLIQETKVTLLKASAILRIQSKKLIQGTGDLSMIGENGIRRFCAVGAIFNYFGWDGTGGFLDGLSGGFPHSSENPGYPNAWDSSILKDQFGIDMWKIIGLNDNQKFTFDQIADILESENL